MVAAQRDLWRTTRKNCSLRFSVWVAQSNRTILKIIQHKQGRQTDSTNLRSNATWNKRVYTSHTREASIFSGNVGHIGVYSPGTPRTLPLPFLNNFVIKNDNLIVGLNTRICQISIFDFHSIFKNPYQFSIFKNQSQLSSFKHQSQFSIFKNPFQFTKV